MAPSTIVKDDKIESLERKWVVFYEGDIIIMYTAYFLVIKKYYMCNGTREIYYHLWDYEMTNRWPCIY